MKRYTPQEIEQMRGAFNTIEAAYVLMDPTSFDPDTVQHRRLNTKMVNELKKEEPDHEKIQFLLNAINTLQNGKQPTAASFPSEEEPQSEKTNRIQRWFKKVRQAWEQTR